MRGEKARGEVGVLCVPILGDVALGDKALGDLGPSAPLVVILLELVVLRGYRLGSEGEDDPRGERRKSPRSSPSRERDVDCDRLLEGEGREEDRR